MAAVGPDILRLTLPLLFSGSVVWFIGVCCITVHCIAQWNRAAAERKSWCQALPDPVSHSEGSHGKLVLAQGWIMQSAGFLAAYKPLTQWHFSIFALHRSSPGINRDQGRRDLGCQQVWNTWLQWSQSHQVCLWMQSLCDHGDVIDWGLQNELMYWQDWLCSKV